MNHEGEILDHQGKPRPVSDGDGLELDGRHARSRRGGSQRLGRLRVRGLSLLKDALEVLAALHGGEIVLRLDGLPHRPLQLAHPAEDEGESHGAIHSRPHPSQQRQRNGRCQNEHRPDAVHAADHPGCHHKDVPEDRTVLPGEPLKPPIERRLDAQGPQGADALHGLAQELEQRAPGHRLQPLELAGGGHVAGANLGEDVAADRHRQQHQGRLPGDNHECAEEEAEVLEELQEVVRQHRVDHIEVLAQPAEDLGRWDGVKVKVHRSSESSAEHPLMDPPGRPLGKHHKQHRTCKAEHQGTDREQPEVRNPEKIAALRFTILANRCSGPFGDPEVSDDAEHLSDEDHEQDEEKTHSTAATGPKSKVEPICGEGQHANLLVLWHEQPAAVVHASIRWQARLRLLAGEVPATVAFGISWSEVKVTRQACSYPGWHLRKWSGWSCERRLLAAFVSLSGGSCKHCSPT
mmetsp:Transcript_97175/g.274865  ORF Transcript_97175/g.274865 Transcript_97175/m.274865 type:complete len:463 (-) Transcript_97175:1884-3272(-)